MGHSRRGRSVAWIDRLPSTVALTSLFLLFALAALAVYSPALHGGFLSDDLVIVATNRYVQEPSAENILAILDPSSPAATAVANWAPLHLLFHAVEWQLFGPATLGYHVINVLLHALASTLFACVLIGSGLSRRWAGLAAALFLLHPANVEAVAWISQSKTTLALVLALCALLFWRARPLCATLAFALALLAKATAAFALPVALLRDWMERGRVRWGWAAAWTLLLAGYALAEFGVRDRTGAEPLSGDLLVLARTGVAIAGRYLVMAATSVGTSAMHEPPLADSWLDPWWLGSVVLLGALGWRMVTAVRAKREESVFWVWAAAAFFPVSPIFPLLYPMADRHLYLILPGLLGGLFFAARLADPEGMPQSLRRGLFAGGLILCALFGWHSYARAAIWTSETRLAEDAAIHYPDGRVAHLEAARLAARSGNRELALRELRAAIDRGYNRYGPLLRLPEFAPLQGDPRFREMVSELAQWWIDWGRALESPTQAELRTAAMAHLARKEYVEAESFLRRALEEGGPLDGMIRNEIELVRRAQRDPSFGLLPP